MTDGEAHRRDVAVCLLATALLIAVAVRHAQVLHDVGTFGLPADDAVLYAVVVVLLAGLAALVDRARRRGLPTRAVQALVVLVVLLATALLPGREDVTYEGSGSFGGGPYSSRLTLDFSPELTWLRGVVAVAALGLLPVAGAGAWLGRGGSLRVPTGRRVVAVLACVLAAGLVLRELERSVALLDVLRGEAQQLASDAAVTWVAGLWALVALGVSARALRRPDVARLALVVPAGVLVGYALLVLEDAPRHDCCFSYAPVEEYVPPPVGPDLLLLAGCLLVGVVLPLGLQRLRVRTSASTPPG